MPAPNSAPPAVVCAGLRFAWPDGTDVLDDLDVAFPTGRTGLVGRNGGGKSTLLRLIAGDLTPVSGTVSTIGAATGDVAYLPQHLPLTTSRTVADLLGIASRRDALRAIESGQVEPARYDAHLEAVGADWDVEDRARETLTRLGVPTADGDVLDRRVGSLSGGQSVLVGVAGVLLQRAAVSLLDEPTNNLDASARDLLYAAVDSWPGVLIVVSHDRDLLEHLDTIVELHDGHARTFGGPYSHYAATIDAELEAAQRRVRTARADVGREHRQYVDAQIRLTRRLRTAAKAEREKRVPKIIAHGRRGQAQVSAGKFRNLHEGRLAVARTDLSAAEDAVRDQDAIRVDLPATAVPSGRTVLEVGELTVRGPERIALLGGNGSGKSTLLDAIAGRRAHPCSGVGRPAVPVAYLPQRLDVLDDAASVLDNVRSAAPLAPVQTVRAGLARFRLRGRAVEQPAGSLSGGERFRVSLARLLLAEPPPQLLLLDEPTNSLDLDSVRQLTEALSAYRGALIVASHDRAFLAEIGIGRSWVVARVGLPRPL